MALITSQTSPGRGIIYIVTGQQYVDEAKRSATSAKICMPEIPITIFSDIPVSLELFDQVVPIENPTHGPEDKILHIGRSPYEETLYLDSDTYVTDDCRELFLLLKQFDLAASHATYRAQYQVSQVPDCFPEFNAGIILFKKTEKIDALFEQWARFYNEDRLKPVSWLLPDDSSWYRGSIPNQPSLRRAIYGSSLRMATLPAEYNCRLSFPGFVHAKVKIIHGRAQSLEKVSEKLNGTTLPRVHVMRWGRLRILDSAMPAGKSMLARTRWLLHNLGVLHTARTTIEKLTQVCGNFLSKLTHS